METSATTDKSAGDNKLKLKLPHGEITLSEALNKGCDILRDLSDYQRKFDFAWNLHQHPSRTLDIVSRHLGIPTTDLEVCEVKEWVAGSFNYCIPIKIARSHHPALPERVIIRFALPYEVGDGSSPAVDEKVRCEAATYIWLQQNCPDVPIPRLYGFGLPGTQSVGEPLFRAFRFTSIEYETLWNRMRWYWRRFASWLCGHGSISPYFAHHRRSLTDFGFLVIEYVPGKTLFQSWEEQRHDVSKRTNLFRGMARIMLSMAKIPLPRIGSWTINDRGIISLSNRPLTMALVYDENKNIPSDIPRNLTYTSLETYYLDLLATQDNRIRYKPDSIADEEDGDTKLASLAAMRTLLPKYIDRQKRHLPFVMSLTDLHQSNLFVDDDWNIQHIIDLEFACTCPTQMLHAPYWLTSKRADNLEARDLEDYIPIYKEFVTAVEDEESSIGCSNVCSRTMTECLNTDRLWYKLAMHHPEGLCSIFFEHIQQKFYKKGSFDDFDKMLMTLWDRDSSQIVASKVVAQTEYEDQIRNMFAIGAARVAEGKHPNYKSLAERDAEAEEVRAKAHDENEGVVAGEEHHDNDNAVLEEDKKDDGMPTTAVAEGEEKIEKDEPGSESSITVEENANLVPAEGEN